MVIYRISCRANNKVYIGLTTNFKQRKAYHFTYLKRNAHPNSLLQNSYNKYGKESFFMEVIEECQSRDELNKAEERWIKFYKAAELGFNFQLGGDSDNPSPRALEKLRKEAQKRNKVVIQYDLEGKEIKRYPSLKIAAQELKCTSGEIQRVCSGELKRCKDFQWRYEKSNLPLLRDLQSKKNESSTFTTDYNRRVKSKAIQQLTKEGEVIEKYESAYDAVRKNKNFKYPSAIHSVLRGKTRIAYGFRWEYL